MKVYVLANLDTDYGTAIFGVFVLELDAERRKETLDEFDKPYAEIYECELEV